jgi:type IV pilus assembly protein PilW
MNVLRNRKGFTLLELLIAMALSVILMAAVYSTYYSQQKSYLVQEQLAAMQQNLRAAMFYMERDIRMAGYDPTRKAGVGITTADDDSISFTEDTDGDATPPFQSVTYILNDNDADGDDDLERNGDLIAENIEVLNFVYLDKDSNDLADDGLGNVKDAANIAKIRSVQVTVAARTGIEDPTYTDPAQGDHYRRKALSSNIKCRNLGL